MDLRQRGGAASSSGVGPSSSSSEKKRRRRKSTSCNAATIGGLMALALVVIGGGYMMISSSSSTASSGNAAEPAGNLRSTDSRNLAEKVKMNFEKQIETLKGALKEAKQQLAKKLPANSPEDKKQKKLFEYYKKSKIHEKQAIKALLKRQLLDKYGPDPHYVEMVISFDPHSNIADTSRDVNDTSTILIQLAPTNDLPATVFWFLEQVNATLYDGASFHRNAGHVVQGGPVANFESKGQNIMQKFKASGLEGVPFQEYSPKFPHVKYTLGYAGRPGGPDFYVSTKDNTKVHGPGGQDSYDDPSEADPCFAKVVQGFDVVDRMAKSAVEPGGYRRMQHYVGIRTMRMVSPSYAATVMANDASNATT